MMNRSRWLIVWLLAFSIGLNAIFVCMGLISLSKRNASATANSTPPPATREKWSWNYTNLFPLDDPDLKLTPEQKKQILDVRRQIDIEELRLNHQTVKNYRHWVKALTNDNLTSAGIDPCVVEMSQGIKDRMMRLMHSIDGQRAVLTPEQNLVLNKRLRTQLREMKDGSLKILNGSKTRMTAQYGEAFVKSIIGPTSGTTERKN